MKKTTLGTTTATFEYDAFGRTSSIRTEEGDNYLVTELEYDEYDRETLRRFDMKGDIQTLKQDYDVCDRIVEKTLMAGEQEDGWGRDTWLSTSAPGSHPPTLATLGAEAPSFTTSPARGDEKEDHV